MLAAVSERGLMVVAGCWVLEGSHWSVPDRSSPLVCYYGLWADKVDLSYYEEDFFE